MSGGAHLVAARVGCRRLRGAGRSVLWECGDPETAVRLLRELADGDVGDDTLRTLGRQMVAAVGRDAEALAREVHGYVLSRVRWVRERVETFQSSAATLRRGFGDCDDHSRLIYALLRTLGIPARIEILTNPKGEPAHAVTRALLPGRGWTWLETSVAAEFGEAPLVAARRLGLHSRLNMPAGLSGLAGLDGVTFQRTPDRRWEDGLIGAGLGALLFAPLGSAVGLAAGVIGPWKVGDAVSVGSAGGALAGAVMGAWIGLASPVSGGGNGP